jgi:hypothetical protein
MNRPAPPLLGARELVALFEAMDSLDDRERALLLEHYFEKVPLAALGERRGVSAVAIWKRIDRAREKLKKSLLGAGFAGASSRFAEALEANVPIAPPMGLVGEAILERILAGGLTLSATKSSVISVSILAALLLLAVGVGGYRFLLSGESTPAPVGVSSGEVGSTAPSDPGRVLRPASASGLPDPVAPDSELVKLLEEYKAFFQEWKRQIAARDIKIDFYAKARAWAKETQPLIFEDPATFLAFIREPSNEEMCGHLIADALNKAFMSGGTHYIDHWTFRELPAGLMDGLLGILNTGSDGLKAPLLTWLGRVQGPSAAFEEQYLRHLHDSDPRVQTGAIIATSRGLALEAGMLEKIRTLFESATDIKVRNAALDAIQRTNTPDVQGWIAAQLEANRDPGSVQTIARAAYWRLSFLRVQEPSTVDSRELDRFAAALTEAARVQKDWSGFSIVVRAALQLPGDRAIPILEEAIRNAPTPGEKRAAEGALARVREGGLKGNKILETEREFFAEARK